MSWQALAWSRAASLLCPHGLWDDQHSANAYGKTASTIAKFLHSAEEGCLGCSMLLRVIDEIVPGWLARYASDAHAIQLEHDYSGFRISLVQRQRSIPSEKVQPETLHTNAWEIRAPTCDNMYNVENSSVTLGYRPASEEKAFARFSLLCLQTGMCTTSPCTRNIEL